MSDSECKAGPYPEETSQERNDACDGSSTLNFSEIIRKRIRKHGMDATERAEKDASKIAMVAAGNERDNQLKQLKWGIRQQDEEKLMRAIENIIRRVMVEERVASKITVYK